MSDQGFKFPTTSRALYEFYLEEEYHELGFKEVQTESAPHKHSSSFQTAVLKHAASGRYVRLNFTSDYNNGCDEDSFDASEVYPHVVTTVEYKRKPAP